MGTLPPHAAANKAPRIATNGRPMGDEMPQCNADETALLGCMLRENDIIPELRRELRVDQFYVYAHQLIYKAILDLADKGAPAGPATLADRVKEMGGIDDIGGYPYIVELWESAPAATPYTYYAERIRDTALRRSMLRQAADMTRDARDYGRSPTEIAAAHALYLQGISEAGSVESRIRPVPLADLQRINAHAEFIWEGIFRRNSVSLFSSSWKCGKSTLVSHLVRSLARGESFLGRKTLPCRILLISEESPDEWCHRRDVLGIGGQVDVICAPTLRPGQRPENLREWVAFVDRIRELCRADAYDLVVVDALPDWWRVENENDAAQVRDAMAPIGRLRTVTTTLLIAHTSKGATRDISKTRGSGVLAASVDCICEMDYAAPDDIDDARRTLAIKARWDAPPRLTVELTDGEFREVAPIGPRGRKPQDTTGKHDAAFLEAIDLLQAEGRPATMGAIRDTSKLNAPNASKAAARLIGTGLVIRTSGVVTVGKSASRPVEVFARPSSGQVHLGNCLPTCSDQLGNAPVVRP